MHQLHVQLITDTAVFAWIRRILVMALIAVIAAAPAMSGERLTIFAAASLKNALDAIGAAWHGDSQKQVTMSYAASSALARQIKEGAPADIFISADLDWMNSLSEDGLIAPGSVTRLLGNEIVLVVPSGSHTAVKIERGFDLAGLLGNGRLAMGDIKAVPAGKYGKVALEFLGVWSSVESKLAMAENVRAALKLVSTGEAAAGIVYATDARAEPGVEVLGTFPAGSHPEIVYPAGIVAASRNTDAAAFIEYLQNQKARAIFLQHGFKVLAPALN